MSRRELLRSIASFGAGAVFSVGLGISGMTRPSKVIGFLDPAGRWDASLALVMGAAVLVGLATFPRILRRSVPLLAPRFTLPAALGVDFELLFGAGVFGIGWGLSGLCPGPAIMAIVTGAPPFLVFVAAMAGGARVASLFRLRRRTSAAVSRGTRETPTGATEGLEATYG